MPMLLKSPIPDNIPSFRARTGVFAPCPRAHVGQIMIRGRSHPRTVREIKIGNTNCTNTLVFFCTNSVALEQTVVSCSFPGIEFGTYPQEWLSDETLVASSRAAERRRHADEDENVVEFRSLPPRMESLASLQGKVRLSRRLPSFARESEVRSPRIEADFEEVPE